MKILVIEDSRRIAQRIRAQFIKNHSVEIAYTGERGVIKATAAEFDVILLDLSLPDITGLEVCQKIRAKGINSPIIVLTGLDTTELKVNLLSSGADDYVTKPYNSEELSARVAAAARRKDRQHYDEVLRIKDLVINRTCRDVTRAGIKLNLRRKEFEVLEYLVLNRGRSLTRAMILSHVWESDRESWNNTVDVHIKHLRDKVDRPFPTKLIRTSYGVGYTVDDDD